MAHGTPLQSSTRLFGRIHAFDLECPKCGDLHSVRAGRKTPGWNPRAGLLRCPGCATTYQLGIVVYPTYPGRPPAQETPQDWIPNPRQAAALRQLQAAYYLADDQARPRSNAPRNVQAPGCLCELERINQAQAQDTYRMALHPRCPVHGRPEDAGVGPEEPGSPQ